jgi:acetolactate decarboxylase
LDLKSASLQVDFDLESHWRLALPQTRELLMADLSGDPPIGIGAG